MRSLFLRPREGVCAGCGFTTPPLAQRMTPIAGARDARIAASPHLCLSCGRIVERRRLTGAHPLGWWLAAGVGLLATLGLITNGQRAAVALLIGGAAALLTSWALDMFADHAARRRLGEHVGQIDGPDACPCGGQRLVGPYARGPHDCPKCGAKRLRFRSCR